ncbi:hypothetical protein R2325_02660 [Mycobacteroides chelonae]|nr:hypothetical protein [Mycobacteroides chelonae]MEC4869471.1 hypothetical protein [Mycobacteroides chelonae]
MTSVSAANSCCACSYVPVDPMYRWPEAVPVNVSTMLALRLMNEHAIVSAELSQWVARYRERRTSPGYRGLIASNVDRLEGRLEGIDLSLLHVLELLS